MLIDIHLLQNHAPSNLNRDDTGSPKEAIFGGFQRARISSQCLKRSMRRSDIFRDAFQADGLLGERTRLFPKLLAARLEERDTPAEAVSAIVAQAARLGRESTKAKADQGEAGEAESLTAQLIFISEAEVSRLAEEFLHLYEEKEAKEFAKMKPDEIAAALRSGAPRSVDIAMFGRMTTSAAFEDVEAAVQVAHAISTHKTEQEFDYYTAVDDISGESGAGFIGDTAFNSATYYKYLSIHWESLVQNLGGDTAVAARAVETLIQAAALVQPTGKQNSFAAHNLPDFVMVEVRDRNVPVSYANAFVKPVRPTHDGSLVDASVHALGEYCSTISTTFGLEGAGAYICTGKADVDGKQHLPSLAELCNWTAERVAGVRA